MKRTLFMPLIFILLSICACKDDEIDASLFKNNSFEEYVYTNYPDQTLVDTIKYSFTEDTLTAIGNMYDSVDNQFIVVDRDTQRYYFEVEGPKLFLKNIEVPEVPELEYFAPYVGRTSSAIWIITKYSHDEVCIDFFTSLGNEDGNTILWKK
jgi:hypothetical protein